MTPTRSEVEGLVVRIQSAFLDTPAVRMTPGQAAKRFGVGVGACEAVLDTLREARVVAVMPSGAYERFFPHAGSPAHASKSRAA